MLERFQGIGKKVYSSGIFSVFKTKKFLNVIWFFKYLIEDFQSLEEFFDSKFYLYAWVYSYLDVE